MLADIELLLVLVGTNKKILHWGTEKNGPNCGLLRMRPKERGVV